MSPEPITEPIIDTTNSELPDSDMQIAIGFLKRVWKLGACRTCEGVHYELMALLNLRLHADMDTLSNGSAHKRPAATLVCSTCGEIRLLDLTVAGVAERMPPKDAPVIESPRI